MMNGRYCFSSITHITPHKVESGNRTYVTTVRKGEVMLRLSVNSKLTTCTLKNVLFIPEFGFQFISI